MKRAAIALGALALMVTSQIFTSQDASAAQYGKASYYWQPQPLASGGRFNPNAMSAAHKTLPFGTKVRVTRQSTGRSVVVTINDRGPYIAGRIIDLSRAAAQRLGMTAAGVTAVRVDIIGSGSVRHLALGGGGGKYVTSKSKRRLASLTAGIGKASKRRAKKKGKSGTRVASLDTGSRKASKRRAKKKGTSRVRLASLDKRSGKKASKRRATKKGKTQRFAGIPKSLRGKKIISVMRRYKLAGKVRTTSGLIPKGATLLREEITYYN
ncbi:MAG: septal ring lytic transglycosylase RlpA family protein [Hyphomicrobiaceae bacterium]